MSDTTFPESLRSTRPLFDPLFSELWDARHADEPPVNARLASIDGLGPQLVEAGIAGSAAVRMVLVTGRTMIELGEHEGNLDGAGARRLGALLDEAAVRVASAIEQARRSRRQLWLAFLVHELKNPLNTVLNALWLLKEKGADPKQAARFLELAERAVRRLDGRARDVRELDEQLLSPPTGWQPKAPSP